MSEVATVEKVAKASRYSVSREGMGGRKAKYTEELLRQIVAEKVSLGISVKANCAKRGLPYVSINAALKRLGIENPNKVKTTSPTTSLVEA
jgi:hypothetical protein